MNKETKKKLPFLMPALCIVNIHVVVLVPAAAAHSSGLSGGVEGEGRRDLLIPRSTSTVAPSISPWDVDGSEGWVG